VASSFDKVKARCLPLPARNAKVEEMIDWIAGEVKTMSDTIWQLNDNFVRISGYRGCLEYAKQRRVPRAGPPSQVDCFPRRLHPAGCAQASGRRWWKTHGLPEALRWLEAADAMIVSKVGT
jgi:hypothetical protein